MKKADYTPNGICARHISVELDDNNVIQNIEFTGGCDGNHKGLVSLCKGMDAGEVIRRMKGIRCGFRTTSCPDQLVCALEECISKN